MNRFARSRLLPAMVIAGPLLVACGGGGGDSGPALVAGTDVPVTATNTSTEAISFVQQQRTLTGADSAEPITLGEAKLATSETDEPDPSI
ncbi:hypothetical protein FN976_21065 [Caenimonas sedimenti]|uniref:Uncharacterized protein n=1 Tax=Caenimonas sedimenti TaxID=2596921 RepID=A0A562ZKE2_9BURK|nr:hypothetical protein [Caenimonas sedimenti]TWO68891.1 hypothetical protein FN976_21065 [Caenimonas sedimenti]